MIGNTTFSEVLTTLGDYSLVILAIAGVVGLIAKWGVVKPLTAFVDDRLEAMHQQHEKQWSNIDNRLSSLEGQMQTNGGASLRDAVNRIETNQVVDEVVHQQIASVLEQLGHPIVVPISSRSRHRAAREHSPDRLE